MAVRKYTHMRIAASMHHAKYSRRGLAHSAGFHTLAHAGADVSLGIHRTPQDPAVGCAFKMLSRGDLIWISFYIDF